MTTLRLTPTSGNPVEITKESALIGRDQGCDVTLNDGSVSRRHARVERRGESWAIVDQGSANGTYIDSHRVTDGVLKNGQELRLGSVSFRVEITGEGDLGQTLAGSSDATLLHPPPQAAPVEPPPPPPAAGPPPVPAAVDPASVPPPPPRQASPPPPPPIPKTAVPPPPPTTPSRPALSSPVPPMDPGPAPKKGKGPFFWMAAGCFGCLGMVILAILAAIAIPVVMSRGSVDVIQKFLADVRHDKLDDAYERLSTDFRARLSRRAFQQVVNDHPTLKDNVEQGLLSSFSGGGVSIVNNRGTVRRPLVSSTGLREMAVFRIVKESGEWKIQSIRLNGVDISGFSAAPDEGTDNSP